MPSLMSLEKKKKSTSKLDQQIYTQSDRQTGKQTNAKR